MIFGFKMLTSYAEREIFMKEIAFIILLISNFIGVAFCQNNYAKLEYDEFIEDKDIKGDVIRIVKDYIAENVKKNGFLVIKDEPSNKIKRFKVIEIFDVVSRKGEVYTVQVDVDEVNGEPRWLLFFDVKNIDRMLKTIRVRNGGRHLRQSSVQ